MWGARRRAALLMVALLVLITIAPFAYSASDPAQSVNCIATAGSTPPGTCIALMIPVALIAILFSITLVALSYIIGNIFDFAGLKDWYKTELTETAKSALIIVIIIAVLVILSSISAILAGQPASTTGQSSIFSNLAGAYTTINNSYFTPQVQLTSDAYDSMIGLSVGLGIIKGLSLSTWIPIPLVPPVIFASLQFGSEENLYVSSVLDSTQGGLSYVADATSLLILPVYTALVVQQDLLWSIIQVGLLVFIPLGLLLRALPFLRGIGGTFIGIGIGLSIIYPAAILALNMPVTSYFSSAGISASACTPSTGGLIGALQGIWCGIINSVWRPTAAFGTGLFTGVNSFNSVYPALNLINYYSVNPAVQLILLVIDLVIVVTASQAIAQMLGGGIRFGLGKMTLA